MKPLGPRGYELVTILITAALAVALAPDRGTPSHGRPRHPRHPHATDARPATLRPPGSPSPAPLHSPAVDQQAPSARDRSPGAPGDERVDAVRASAPPADRGGSR